MSEKLSEKLKDPKYARALAEMLERAASYLNHSEVKALPFVGRTDITAGHLLEVAELAKADILKAE